MKPCCSQAQQDHGTPRTPYNVCLGWGADFLGRAGGSWSWAQQHMPGWNMGAHGFSLQACVCFPVVPGALSASWVSLVLN